MPELRTRGHPPGASAALRETIGHRHFAVNQADDSQRLARTRAALAEGVFDTAWATGHAMTLDAAIQYALKSDAPAEWSRSEPPRPTCRTS